MTVLCVESDKERVVDKVTLQARRVTQPHRNVNHDSELDLEYDLPIVMECDVNNGQKISFEFATVKDWNRQLPKLLRSRIRFIETGVRKHTMTTTETDVSQNDDDRNGLMMILARKKEPESIKPEIFSGIWN